MDMDLGRLFEFNPYEQYGLDKYDISDSEQAKKYIKSCIIYDAQNFDELFSKTYEKLEKLKAAYGSNQTQYQLSKPDGTASVSFMSNSPIAIHIIELEKRAQSIFNSCDIYLKMGLDCLYRNSSQIDATNEKDLYIALFAAYMAYTYWLEDLKNIRKEIKLLEKQLQVLKEGGYGDTEN